MWWRRGRGSWAGASTPTSNQQEHHAGAKGGEAGRFGDGCGDEAVPPGIVVNSDDRGTINTGGMGALANVVWTGIVQCRENAAYVDEAMVAKSMSVIGVIISDDRAARNAINLGGPGAVGRIDAGEKIIRQDETMDEIFFVHI